MKERYKRYKTKKAIAIDKMGEKDAMATRKPKASASEWFRRPAYSVKKKERH
jgi:hypothetical protein